MTIALAVLAFLFVTVGISILFDMNISSLAKAARKVKIQNNTTFGEDVGILRGEMPKSLFKRETYDIQQILKATGREDKYAKVRLFSLLFIGVGILVAFVINNIFLAIPLALAGWYLPSFYVRATAASYKRKINAELESSLSVITSSYLRSEDVVKAIEENIDYINPPVRQTFEEFLMEIRYVNANTINGLSRMKLSIHNVIFHEWINILIRCQTDRTAKDSLLPIVRKFSTVRVVQSEIDALIAEAKNEFYIMSGLVVANIPLLYVMDKEWYETLVYTTGGKITLALVALLMLFSYIKVIKLAEPVEYKTV